MTHCLTKNKPVKLRKGQIHLVDENEIWLSYRNIIFLSVDYGLNWQKVLSLNVPKHSWALKSRLISRLLRLEVSIITKTENALIVLGFGHIYKICLITFTLLATTKMRSPKRPLTVCQNHNGHIFYGDYCSNSDRKPINIHKLNTKTFEHVNVLTLNGIRHVHAVQWDAKTDTFFIATGDHNHECWVKVFDKNFNFVETIAEASQMSRTVETIIENSSVFYCTDDPDNQNFLIEVCRTSKKLTKLCKVKGTVFYLKSTCHGLVFSNVCEPSEFNETEVCSLMSYKKQTGVTNLLYETTKDPYPMRLFQYGTLRQPIYMRSQQNKFIYFTEWATKNDYTSYRLDLT